MVFSTNQVRQLFVVNNVATTLANPGDAKAIEITGINGDTSKPAYMIQSLNADGDPVKSDYIIKPQIRQINIRTAANLHVNKPAISITNTKTVMSGTPATGDYTDGDTFYINFTFPAFISLTNEEDFTKTVSMRYNYNKQGVPYTTEKWGNVALKDNWAVQMAKAIYDAFNARQNMDNTLIEVGMKQNTVSNNSVWNEVIIVAKDPIWRRGLSENRLNDFTISNLTFENLHNPELSSLPLENNSRVIVYGSQSNSVMGNAFSSYTFPTGDTTVLATVPDYYIKDGKMIADLEYFCMGERGDIYRMKGWPNFIETRYLVKPDKEYDVVDIHHYYQGEGTNDDKSEKVTTLVFKVADNGTSQLASVTDTDDLWELLTTGTVGD